MVNCLNSIPPVLVWNKPASVPDPNQPSADHFQYHIRIVLQVICTHWMKDRGAGLGMGLCLVGVLWNGMVIRHMNQ